MPPTKLSPEFKRITRALSSYVAASIAMSELGSVYPAEREPVKANFIKKRKHLFNLLHELDAKANSKAESPS